MTHMMQNHLSESNELPFIPLQLLVTTHITKGEEISMKIPLVKTEEWRDDNQVLDSDQIEIIEEEDVEDEEDETSEDEIEDQTLQNIEERWDDRENEECRWHLLHRGKDHPKRGNIRDFSIICSR